MYLMYLARYASLMVDHLQQNLPVVEARTYAVCGGAPASLSGIGGAKHCHFDHVAASLTATGQD